ncbi:MAG: hypothetical protein LIP01_05980 [Tannerellaceae bacterium]|nr:hypothetical protein [Tannerellaceae bacterium]
MERLVDLVIKVEPFYDPEILFAFKDYPQISNQANELFRELYSRLYLTIRNGVTTEWEKANQVTDDLVKSVFGESVVDDKRFARYFDRNQKAMDAFFQRKTSAEGLNLSKRIWNLEGQFREDMEPSIDCLIGQVKSADVISREIRDFLEDPDKLFRRVRDPPGRAGVIPACPVL